MFMGFKDWFMEDKSRETYSVKVTCTNCNRVTVVKIPQGKLLRNGVNTQNVGIVIQRIHGLK